MRVGVQYTMYSRFNGAGKNFDGRRQRLGQQHAEDLHVVRLLKLADGFGATLANSTIDAHAAARRPRPVAKFDLPPLVESQLDHIRALGPETGFAIGQVKQPEPAEAVIETWGLS
jgi:hypothetical protein